MCNILLLGSDINIPTSKWSENNPRFCVEEISQNCIKWKNYFSKPNVYYLNSPEGCGCGFEFDIKKELKDIEDFQMQWNNLSNELRKEIGYSPQDQLNDFNRKNQGCNDLVNLIKRLLQQTNELEMYALLQESTADYKPTLYKTITPNDIVFKRRFSLFPRNNKERIFYKVINRI